MRNQEENKRMTVPGGGWLAGCLVGWLFCRWNGCLIKMASQKPCDERTIHE